MYWVALLAPVLSRTCAEDSDRGPQFPRFSTEFPGRQLHSFRLDKSMSPLHTWITSSSSLGSAETVSSFGL